ncbi:hypothetical protein FOL46_009257 [Perkinsus olseni]|uniref:Uncharacterized protein n=1 Tax=Perkinsus olseni TaxID=32597 RepID=A0A7J6MLE9_PEROL|nr:hypothetical protein FOL46_009257 [Perkinsus olseni]
MGGSSLSRRISDSRRRREDRVLASHYNNIWHMIRRINDVDRSRKQQHRTAMRNNRDTSATTTVTSGQSSVGPKRLSSSSVRTSCTRRSTVEDHRGSQHVEHDDQWIGTFISDGLSELKTRIMRQIIDNNLSAHENSLIALLKRIRSKLKDNHHLYNIAADDSIDEDSINVLFNELEDELQLPTGSTANNPSPNVQAVKYCSSIAHRRHPHVVLDEHTRNYAPVIAAVEASRGDRTIAGCGRSGDQGLMPSWATMGHSSSCSDEKGSTAGEDPSTVSI